MSRAKGTIKSLLQTDFPRIFTSGIRLVAGCRASLTGTSKRHEVRVFNQQMLEAPDEKLSTERGMVGENPVQYSTGVDQQEAVLRHSIILVLNTLVKDLERGRSDGV